MKVLRVMFALNEVRVSFLADPVGTGSDRQVASSAPPIGWFQVPKVPTEHSLGT